jgi:hypothetical protein
MGFPFVDRVVPRFNRVALEKRSSRANPRIKQTQVLCLRGYPLACFLKRGNELDGILEISEHQQSWGYEEGLSKGPRSAGGL